MKFCVLVKEDVLVFEALHAENASDIIMSLFRQGFVLAPVLIEANNSENARACFLSRYEWQEVTAAFQQRKVLVC
ncbi:hypothetical protein KDD30_10610 [Photobacterium sp. GJ3]|uniref:hypothetical protein n=1 Tax=Photobacterium sp. GJ3 TaxID=2829502 RepID=UPI001B8BCAD4|nr:hypothetical protein [Photobacterium sp. GJ3]QUJ66612.1 hypothetical protein KDD30_10610 [Photobacterium sp. GJ3]